MRKNLYLAFIFFLSGCSYFNAGNIAPGYIQAFGAIKNAIQGYENNLITSAIIENIPYASSIVRIGNGPFGLMILESVQDDKSIWVTADRVYFVIKRGKIIETKGLPNNLTNLLLPSYFEQINLDEINTKDTLTYYYSYDEPELFDLEIKAVYQNKGKEIVRILENEMELTLILEEITNEFIGWNVTNSYWLDDEGYVWKSQQQISPKLPSISYEITKKPSL